ncbi:DUF4307 domain-containing protein [Actinacidiphila rubida]|uniref:DUF4307 domain-containing protein n=1 Tax=Actinacidiphila rubida TaxID=310780 RepID=A0A1H8TG27_9ACTN|nr:DUF4307 domain-containing protein [Actinacidiphila rubida]SEO90040.1 protein of unknown function [Actinacidiphila rubida]
MTAVQSEPPASPPEGRYGSGDRRFDRDADARADRTLRRVALVLGVLVAVGIGWYGWRSIADSPVSAQVVAFKAVSDQAVEIHLEVHKDAGSAVVCTLRSEDADHNEVGRKDVRLTQHAGQVDTVVTVRTTARGTTGELVGCSTASR